MKFLEQIPNEELDRLVEIGVFKSTVFYRVCMSAECDYMEVESLELNQEVREYERKRAKEGKDGFYKMLPCKTTVTCAYNWSEEGGLDENGNHYWHTHFEPVPNYSTNLNAIALAEAKIIQYVGKEYFAFILALCGFDQVKALTANARIRAIACIFWSGEIPE